MTYRLVMDDEVIEDGIEDYETAEFLMREYCLAFHRLDIKIEEEE